MTTKSKLYKFLAEYDIKVSDLEKLSGQSPHTLRNWFNYGQVTDKSYLILCIIASIKLRRHENRPCVSYAEPVHNRTLNGYLYEYNMTFTHLTVICHQSYQTLKNWLQDDKKAMMFDCIIDAVRWYNAAYENGEIVKQPSFAQLANALKHPVMLNQNKTKFALAEFIETKSKSRYY